MMKNNLAQLALTIEILTPPLPLPNATPHSYLQVGEQGRGRGGVSNLPNHTNLFFYHYLVTNESVFWGCPSNDKYTQRNGSAVHL